MREFRRYWEFPEPAGYSHRAKGVHPALSHAVLGPHPFRGPTQGSSRGQQVEVNIPRFQPQEPAFVVWMCVLEIYILTIFPGS